MFPQTWYFNMLHQVSSDPWTSGQKHPDNFSEILWEHICEKIWRRNVKQNTTNNSPANIYEVIFNSKVII